MQEEKYVSPLSDEALTFGVGTRERNLEETNGDNGHGPINSNNHSDTGFQGHNGHSRMVHSEKSAARNGRGNRVPDSPTTPNGKFGNGGMRSKMQAVETETIQEMVCVYEYSHSDTSRSTRRSSETMLEDTTKNLASLTRRASSPSISHDAVQLSHAGKDNYCGSNETWGIDSDIPSHHESDNAPNYLPGQYREAINDQYYPVTFWKADAPAGNPHKQSAPLQPGSDDFQNRAENTYLRSESNTDFTHSPYESDYSYHIKHNPAYIYHDADKPSSAGSRNYTPITPEGIRGQGRPLYAWGDFQTDSRLQPPSSLTLKERLVPGLQDNTPSDIEFYDCHSQLGDQRETPDQELYTPDTDNRDMHLNSDGREGDHGTGNGLG